MVNSSLTFLMYDLPLNVFICNWIELANIPELSTLFMNHIEFQCLVSFRPHFTPGFYKFLFILLNVLWCASSVSIFLKWFICGKMTDLVDVLVYFP